MVGTKANVAGIISLRRGYIGLSLGPTSLLEKLSQDLQDLSPTARRFAQSGPRFLALWTLPLAPLDLPRWLEERTNASTNGGDVLTWEWPPSPP